MRKNFGAKPILYPMPVFIISPRTGILTTIFSVFRREIDGDISAEQFRFAVSFCVGSQSFSDFFHQFKSHILMRHFPSAERKRNFQPEFLFQKIQRPAEFSFIIVLVDIDMKLHLNHQFHY